MASLICYRPGPLNFLNKIIKPGTRVRFWKLFVHFLPVPQPHLVIVGSVFPPFVFLDPLRLTFSPQEYCCECMPLSGWRHHFTIASAQAGCPSRSLRLQIYPSIRTRGWRMEFERSNMVLSPGYCSRIPASHPAVPPSSHRHMAGWSCGGTPIIASVFQFGPCFEGRYSSASDFGTNVLNVLKSTPEEAACSLRWMIHFHRWDYHIELIDRCYSTGQC